MITIEQYNKAVQIINEFHKQISKSIEAVSKTTIREFLVANKDLDTRTRNALIRIDDYYKGKQSIMYIEDLDRTTFLKARDTGKNSWEKFIKARGY